jgi:hypothetical protein
MSSITKSNIGDINHDTITHSAKDQNKQYEIQEGNQNGYQNHPKHHKITEFKPQ